MSLDDSHRMYGFSIHLDGKYGSNSNDLCTVLDSSFSGMHKSMSMIELSNLPLVHGLSDELEALSDTSSREDEDEFFFYDDENPTEDSVSIEDKSQDCPNKDDFGAEETMPSEGLTFCSEKKMRRVQSFAGFQQENVSNKFLKAISTVATIAEEDEFDDNKSNAQKLTSNKQLNNKNSVSLPKKQKDHKHCPLQRPKKSALKNSSDEIYIDRKMMRTYSSKDMRSYCSSSTCSSSQSLEDSLHASLTSLNSNEPKMTRNISFSTLEVRTYGVTLGDNPGGSSGPPVSLDWNYDESKAIDLEDYEAKRNPRRSREQLHMDMNNRYFSLASHFTATELKAATLAARQTRIKRKKSYSKTGIEPIQEAMESTEKLFKKFMRRTRKN